MSLHVKVTHTLDDLDRDMTRIIKRAPRDLSGLVRDGVKAANTVGKDRARRTAGAHGKYYWRAWTWETSSFHGFGASSYSGEYGPQVDRKQARLPLERGTRNTPPHGDLAMSADYLEAQLPHEVEAVLDEWFW